MAKYRRAITPEELEEQAELEALEAEKAELEEEKAKEKERVERQTPEASHEEDTFKKRYGDLRAHSQRVENELRTEIENLKSQVENAAKSQLEMKEIASADDAKKWAAKYPEIAKIVRYIANEESKETTQKSQKDIDELKAMRAQIERDRSYAKLLELVPDFETVRSQSKFHEWLDNRKEEAQRLNKKDWAYSALVEKNDPFEAADAVKLYKVETAQSEPVKKEPPKKDMSGAENVTRKSGGGSEVKVQNEVVWSESYIEEMSKKDPKFFDKNEDEIMKAIHAGKFKYDLSQE